MSDTDRNQFKKLRYKDNLTLNPDLTIREMSDITGLGASTISKIEHEGWKSATATTIKAYHDAEALDVSYEYLFGETKTKSKKYHELGKLFPFDDTFYAHLEQLLALDDKNNHFVEYMLSALIYNPQEMFNTLNTIFNALYTIHTIQNNKNLSVSEKDSMIKMQEYVFNQSTIEYLENTVMPLLGRVFEINNTQQGNEATITQEIVDELQDEIGSSISIASIRKLTNE